MCDFCKDGKPFFVHDTISTQAWGWGGPVKITRAEAEEVTLKLGVFIDRGYLRLADWEDTNCLDHGEKVKINFCPECGAAIAC